MAEAGIVAEADTVVRGLALTGERLTDAALITTNEAEPRIAFANAGFVRLTGLPAARLRGCDLRVLQAPEHFKDELSQFHPTMVANGSFFMDVRLRRSDGKKLLVEWQATPVVDERGASRYLFSIVRDVTRQRRERRALARERERTRVALAAIADAVACVDVAGRIEEMNLAAESLSQWPAAEAKGRSAAEIFRINAAASGDAAADPVAACIVTGDVVVAPGRLLLRGRGGRQTPVKVRAVPLRGEGGGVRGAVLVLRETDPQTGAGRGGARRDRLTGLIDRSEFERRLERVTASGRQHGRSQVLLHLDLDHFKRINETAGSAAGDEVLRQVAGMLRSRFRERDTLARLGGDSFALLLDNCTLDEAEKIADTLATCLKSRPFPVPGRDQALRVSASIGLVDVSSASGTAQQLLSQADLACYTAKELGRGRSHVYRSTRLSLETAPVVLFPQEFRSALEQDRFQLYYQPIMPLQEHSRLPVHYEFLLRHRTERGQLVLPSTLIAAAERHGLMAAVDRWVIRAALAHLVAHRRRFGQGTIAINLSGNSLDDPGVVDYVVAQLAAHGVEARMVCFEITETEAIRDLVHAANVAGGLKRLGCAIALDDFGSGQSSFTYLKALPADYLKIDGSFVRQLTESEVDRSIVSAINATGRIMGLKTIAEFAHNDAIIDCLRDLGVDYAQGDAIAPPRPLPALQREGESEPQFAAPGASTIDPEPAP